MRQHCGGGHGQCYAPEPQRRMGGGPRKKSSQSTVLDFWPIPFDYNYRELGLVLSLWVAPVERLRLDGKTSVSAFFPLRVPRWHSCNLSVSENHEQRGFATFGCLWF